MMKKWWVAGTLVLSMSCVNSYAVEPVTTVVAAGSAAKAAMESTAAVTSAATAAGLIGAGTATAITGAGAGIAAGYAGGYFMNKQFFNECEEKQQNACEKAKQGTYTGATVGTLGSLAALWAADASLAGIGAALGGGAIVGTTALIAAPVVVAALAGGGTYWWLTSDTADVPAPNEEIEANNPESADATPANVTIETENLVDSEPEIEENEEETPEVVGEEETPEVTGEEGTAEEPPVESEETSEETPATETAT